MEYLEKMDEDAILATVLCCSLFFCGLCILSLKACTCTKKRTEIHNYDEIV